MAKKQDLKKLRRADLLELMLDQAKEIEALRAQIDQGEKPQEALREGEVVTLVDCDAAEAKPSAASASSTKDSAAGSHSFAEPSAVAFENMADEVLEIEEAPSNAASNAASHEGSSASSDEAKRRDIRVPSPLHPPLGMDYSATGIEAVALHVMLGATEASSRIVDDARLKAAGIVAQAREEAAGLVAQAHEEARRIADEARDDAVQVRLAAAKEADAVRRRSQVVCDDLLANTRKSCADLFAQAEREIDVLFEQASDRARDLASSGDGRWGEGEFGRSADGRF